MSAERNENLKRVRASDGSDEMLKESSQSDGDKEHGVTDTTATLGKESDLKPVHNKNLERLVEAKRAAQAERCENLMTRLNKLEFPLIEKHLKEQFGSVCHEIDSLPRNSVEMLTEMVDKATLKTDYDDSLLDVIQQEINEDTTGEYPSELKSKAGFAYARNFYHVNERKKLAESAKILNEVIETSVLDPYQTDSNTEDETEHEALLYETVPAGKVREYQPIERTPLSKWAKYRSHFISSWNWLNHRIADVEFRSKTQKAIHAKLMQVKPPFEFGHPDPVSASTSASSPFMSVHSESNGKGPKIKSSLKASRLQPSGFAPDPLHCTKSKRTKTANSDSSNQDDDNKLKFFADACINSLKGPFGRDVVNDSPSQTFRSQGDINEGSATTTEDESDSQVAARCRPLKTCKPRKIFQMNGIRSWMNAVREPILIGDCPCQPGDACVLCLGEKYENHPEEPASFRDRVASLDPRFHKVLSTPDAYEILPFKSWANPHLQKSFPTEALPSFYRNLVGINLGEIYTHLKNNRLTS